MLHLTPLHHGSRWSANSTPQKDLKLILVTGSHCGQDGREPISPGARLSPGAGGAAAKMAARHSTSTVARPCQPDNFGDVSVPKKCCCFGRAPMAACVLISNAKVWRRRVRVYGAQATARRCGFVQTRLLGLESSRPRPYGRGYV